MAGLLNIPKFVDFRDKVKRHQTSKFPVLSLKSKTTIVIHHSLTRRGLAGSNAEGYARYHVDTHGWPSIGYSYVIEPDGTIKFCNDIELRTYHVGNHNNYCVGICLTGDFRYEEPTDEQKESLRNLVGALKREYTHLKYVKGHNEFSGYEWKQCPVFDYKKVLSEKGTVIKASALPNQYTIQQGDTFWSIAKGLDLTVDDLIKANPDVKPTQLQIGQKINLGNTTSETAPNPAPDKPEAKPKEKLVVDGYEGPLTIKAEQKYFGTPVDGIISEPSLLVKARQKLLGVKQDGYAGPITIKAEQRRYGTPVDGVINKPSLMIKERQRGLNNGKL